MKVTVELDDGKTQVFQHVSDCYLAVRQQKPIMNKLGEIGYIPEMTSWSWGGNVRELLKELRQSTIELEDYLKGQRNGGSS